MLRKIIFVILAIAIFCPLSSYAIDRQAFNDQMNALRKKPDAEQQATIDAVQKILATDKDLTPEIKANANAIIGEAYGRLGEVEKGLQYCEDSLKIEKTFFNYVQFANLLLKKKDYYSAYESMKNALPYASNDKAKKQVEEKMASIRVKYLTVSATTLYAAFDENEVAAEDQYKNKTIFVNGKISAITTDAMNYPVVTLDGGRQGFAKVNCVFSKDDRKQAASLKKGAKVTVQGICDGMTMGQVFIKKCAIQ